MTSKNNKKRRKQEKHKNKVSIQLHFVQYKDYVTMTIFEPLSYVQYDDNFIKNHYFKVHDDKNIYILKYMQ